MASDRSALSSTFAGSKLAFYQQHDDTIRVRVYTSALSFDFECIISAADWTSLKAALAAAGDSYDTGVLGPGGADHTVNVT
jgi:hypothetical protein